MADTEAQSKMRESVKEKKVQKRYDEEFKRQAVELVINSITKDHVHGYISAPKYKASELATGSTANDRQKLAAGPR